MVTGASTPASANTVAPESRSVRCGAISLHVREWMPSDTQESPQSKLTRHLPIVLVHGLASNARLWDGAAMSLAGKGYRVVAIDQRGHGLSDKPDGGYDMPTVVNDLSSLIVAMQLDRPVVAGQSWGGNVVVELANRHPELVSGVCAVDGGLIQLVDRFPDWETCAKLLAPPQLTGTRASDFERMIRNAYSDWPETAILGTLANMEVLSDGTIRPWLSRERHMQVLRGLWDHRPREVVNSLRRPVLFTPADGNDRPAGASDARGIRKREEYDAVVSGLEHVRVEWFSPAHHDLHAQFPQRWAQTLHTYIENGFLT